MRSFKKIVAAAAALVISLCAAVSAGAVGLDGTVFYDVFHEEPVTLASADMTYSLSTDTDASGTRTLTFTLNGLSEEYLKNAKSLDVELGFAGRDNTAWGIAFAINFHSDKITDVTNGIHIDADTLDKNYFGEGGSLRSSVEGSAVKAVLTIPKYNGTLDDFFRKLDKYDAAVVSASTWIATKWHDECIIARNDKASSRDPVYSRPGDLNKDGKVNIADATILLKAVSTGSSEKSYDLNGDGKVNVSDATYLLRIIAGSV